MASVGTRRQRGQAGAIARLAVRSLYVELCLYPKPGLVSLIDSGSHGDMDAATFMRSLFALRHYFRDICLAGMHGAPFAQLKQLGIAAEARMMGASRGVNTHRGAIFSLGLLCAAAGRIHARALPLSAATLRSVMLQHWGAALAAHSNGAVPANRAVAAKAVNDGDDGDGDDDDGGDGGNDGGDGDAGDNDDDGGGDNRNAGGNGDGDHGNAGGDAGQAGHGQRAAALHAASGAREEGALGLPSVFEVGLPALRATLARGGSIYHARIDALFALMGHVSDTNVLHRGGVEGARLVRDEARRFVVLGGTAHAGWRERAMACHHRLVRHRLSPGGAADLLAATCLVHAMAARGRA
ncbi:triphosphoribosyl-dephospho-CoA synthase [Rugamonas sp.]|uniref:triphosphoribosyl-dephospho-CoA synthase n=1 Tax=Rugamonas sp. TaxID=1926287 RepID=UPI0025DCC593|nr:triphosphoribosyl-dephospho-CoA synthase [Rugamonas sp.]